MASNRLFGALSITRKAGKLTGGFDAVCESVAKGDAALVLFASNLSPATKKRVLTSCGSSICPVRDTPLTQAELATITQKPVGVLAVTNRDLAALCLNALEKDAVPQPDKEELV